MAKDKEVKEMLETDVHVRHPNRQTHKTWKEKEETQDVVETVPQEIEGMLTKEKLKELAEYSSDCCITLVLPTFRAGMEVNENQNFRLYKNMLQDLKAELGKKNSDSLKTERILEPAFELLRNDQFWRNQGDGLAFFIADGYFSYIKLPYKPEQETIVNNSFYLSNLLRLMNTSSADQFYLLLMRRERVKLFKADAHGLHAVDAEGMPQDITSVVDFEDSTEDASGENTDTVQRINAGRPEKLIVSLYVEKVNTALQNHLPKDTNWPVLLAGDAELLDAFRKSSQYTNIFATNLEITDEHADARKIFQQAKEKIEENWKEVINTRLQTYYDSIATPLTNSMPESVIPAAFYSQVRTLFVERGAHLWGHFDAQNNQLVIHATREDGDDCLLEKAALQTVLHAGDVYILDKEKMPKGATIAAQLRY